jgi:hypothetical protein
VYDADLELARVATMRIVAALGAAADVASADMLYLAAKCREYAATEGAPPTQ